MTCVSLDSFYPLQVSAMSRFISPDHRVSNVAILAGTHGNEKTAIYAAKEFERRIRAQTPRSFEITFVTANPGAVAKNVRYCDTDLARCFTSAILNDPEAFTLAEHCRARELDALIGPKASPQPVADFVVDLHNTTAATGILLLMHPEDVFAHQVAAYLQLTGSTVHICEWAEAPEHAFPPTVGRSGFSLEVGQVSHGCVDVTLLQTTVELLCFVCDFVQHHNKRIEHPRASLGSIKLEILRVVRSVDFPRDDQGDLTAFIHPAVVDYAPLTDGAPLFLHPDGTVTEFKAESVEGVEVVPIFVNEAAYYEKGAAMVLVRRLERAYEL
eukprot:TRINITY_DN9472_c0_g1_i1.p1 TRINITY_DN9472_c0_g1~~TRINITY_DN9472_c0_g1_i1.p1  ORF type:complete len:327 (+),score=51.25 TRINITY_DN9472_c0_g1_i1:785-1765(+)